MTVVSEPITAEDRSQGAAEDEEQAGPVDHDEHVEHDGEIEFVSNMLLIGDFIIPDRKQKSESGNWDFFFSLSLFTPHTHTCRGTAASGLFPLFPHILYIFILYIHIL